MNYLVALIIMFFSLTVQALSVSELSQLIPINKPAQDFLQKEDRPKIFVTLSLSCPCSFSHLEHLSQLSEAHKEKIQFIGLLADPFTTVDESKTQLLEMNLKIPIFFDIDLLISRKLEAVTTPHAFYFSGSQTLLYQGAVSSSHTFSSENVLYLKEAIEKNHAGIAYKKKTKPLGCTISYP